METTQEREKAPIKGSEAYPCLEKDRLEDLAAVVTYNRLDLRRGIAGLEEVKAPEEKDFPKTIVLSDIIKDGTPIFDKMVSDFFDPSNHAPKESFLHDCVLASSETLPMTIPALEDHKGGVHKEVHLPTFLVYCKRACRFGDETKASDNFMAFLEDYERYSSIISLIFNADPSSNKPSLVELQLLALAGANSMCEDMVDFLVKVRCGKISIENQTTPSQIPFPLSINATKKLFGSKTMQNRCWSFTCFHFQREHLAAMKNPEGTADITFCLCAFDMDKLDRAFHYESKNKILSSSS